MPHLDVAPVIGCLSPYSVTGIFLRDINQREGIFVGVLNETEGSRRGRRSAQWTRIAHVVSAVLAVAVAVGVSDGRTELQSL